jgi:hypothetical protein
MVDVTIDSLPVGRTVEPVPVPHFPDALHAVVWRNWDVVDAQHLAKVLGGTPQQIAAIAASMGLPAQRRIESAELRRNYMTLLRRNWHLLPYEQLCALLGWDARHMQFALNEDDFMWVKLGGYKPNCPPVRYKAPDDAARKRASQIADIVQKHLGNAMTAPAEPPFGFIERFNHAALPPADAKSTGLRMVYPYFLRFGDPLMAEGINDIPEGYLAELAACGVNAIWLQTVLNTLYPWDLAPHLSKGWEERIANLKSLVERCGKFGIKVMIYLNEPRAMPPAFFEDHPELRGVNETPDRAPYSPNVVTLCTSTKTVQDFLVNAVRHVFEHVHGLGGILSLTYSENLTNCYSRTYDDSHDPYLLRTGDDAAAGKPKAVPCPRCAQRGPETVNAEVCTLLERGMRLAGSDGRFLLYVWSTPAQWVQGIIDRLPESTHVLCVSEWGKTFTRGDYTGTVNEYSISIIGPGEQALGQWEIARKRGLKTTAKMQLANTYEISSIPYIPAIGRVAQHLANVTEAGVDGMMFGWTAGGSPSPNLELATEFSQSSHPTAQQAMRRVAQRRFGDAAAGEVVKAWELLSEAYGEFPFDISVCYNAPQSLGPANLLFARPTGLVATMVTFPFDDLDGWRGPYSAKTFESQFQKTADLWQKGADRLNQLRKTHPSPAMEDEWRIAEAAGIHFRSTANQARFIQKRQSDPAAAAEILKDEIKLSRKLFDLVGADSRIGFEATNQYGYIRYDLVEKILNCEDLLTQFSKAGVT